MDSKQKLGRLGAMTVFGVMFKGWGGCGSLPNVALRKAKHIRHVKAFWSEDRSSARETGKREMAVHFEFRGGEIEVRRRKGLISLRRAEGFSAVGGLRRVGVVRVWIALLNLPSFAELEARRGSSRLGEQAS